MKKTYISPETDILNVQLQHLMVPSRVELTNQSITDADDFGARDYDMDDDWD